MTLMKLFILKGSFNWAIPLCIAMRKTALQQSPEPKSLPQSSPVTDWAIPISLEDGYYIA